MDMTTVFEQEIDQAHALDHAHKIQKRVIESGFKWTHMDSVFDKIEEELQEVRSAHASGDKEHTKAEVGDLLFAVIKLASYLDFDPEEALEGCNAKFIKRFNFMETHLKHVHQKPLKDCSLNQMLAGWAAAKNAGL
ncbi:MAG: hypothetical protein ACI9TY_001183 [Alphaproteobacteria bacterium]|jgi:uncharacterized protein YabN with tetrapyrrole methylase and pyrophosphatase domain